MTVFACLFGPCVSLAAKNIVPAAFMHLKKNKTSDDL